MAITTFNQEFVASARQPSRLMSPVDQSRLLGNVDEFTTLTQALNSFNIFPHVIVSIEFSRHQLYSNNKKITNQLLKHLVVNYSQLPQKRPSIHSV